MVNELNFIVRTSGRKKNAYYIDYSGAFKIAELAKLTGIDASVVENIFVSNGGEYDKDFEVYYFNSIEAAKKTISDIILKIDGKNRGRMIYLTETEIEYIRKALINEGHNTIHIRSKIKDGIFKKLNG